MAPRGKNTVFRVTSIPMRKKAETLLQSVLNDLLCDNENAESIAIVKETLSGGSTTGSFGELSEDEQARCFLRAAIRLEMTGEERASCKINIEIIPCCYNDNQRSALVHFVGGIPQFALQQNGPNCQPKNVFQIIMDTLDVSFDLNFYGFTQMYATEGDIAADVVAVNGLDGHAWESWRGQGIAGRMWLRDYLREDFPHLRTMTYGYNSSLQSHNVDTIMDYGLGFLEEIRKVRKTEDEKERPLILIGHSFGGLLIAHSLVKASFKKADDPLLRATVGMIFFGVPHKGLVVTDIYRMVKEEHPRQELLKHIKKKSQLLADQLADFTNILEDRRIVSFYERKATEHPKQDPETQNCKRGEEEFSIVVDEDSALLKFPDDMEDKIPVDVDHSNMVKFDSKSDQIYSSVVRQLKKFVKGSDEVVSSRLFSDGGILSDMKLLRDKASNCIDALHEMRSRRTCGSCLWISNCQFCPQLFQWENAAKSDFLLITAPPGFGKSYMCAYLEGRFRKQLNSLCLYFFCDDKSDSRRTELQILRTIVYQLTNGGPDRAVRREIARRVFAKRAEFKSNPQGICEEPFDSSEHLWKILMSVCAVMIPGIREIRCIIDALDECEPESRRRFLRRIKDFYHSSEHSEMPTFLKFVISCRSYPAIISQLPQTDEIQLNKMGNVRRDVEVYIEIECQQIAQRYSLSENFVSQLSNMLKSGAGGMFLWATLSIDSVRSSLQSWKEKPRPWNFSPTLVPSGGLDNLIEDLLSKLHSAASNALKWATLSIRPLTKDEITCINQYIAQNTNETHRRAGEHELDCSPLGYYDGADSLHIYHQSIKDHIRDKITGKDLQLMAGACMTALNSPIGSGLHQYSSLHWFEHITPKLELDEKLLDQIRQLYNPKKGNFAAWLKWVKNSRDVRPNYESALWWICRTEGITPLHLTAFCNQQTVMEKLPLSKNRRKYPPSKVIPWRNLGPSNETRAVNLKTSKGQTALLLAAREGHEVIVKLLLDCNELQADFRDSNGRTPLSYAAGGGHEAIFRLLLDCKEVQADCGDEEGRTPLSYAAGGGYEAIVKLLLDRKDVQADSRGAFERTPLSYAAEGGHEATVKLLLDRKDVQVNFKDTLVGSPLLYAAGRGYDAIVKLLLDHKDVQADSRDIDGITPLSYAASMGFEAIFKLLLDREDVQADSRDTFERTPLSYAAEEGRKAIVKLLLDSKDVQADSSDIWKRTPLSYAVGRGHVETARLLLDSKNVQADSKDSGGRTPLLHAAARGHVETAKLLLDREDIQADSRDSEGRTPLLHAAGEGHRAIVKLLLDRKDVQPDSRDKWERTPLSYAAEGGYEAIVNLLLDRKDVQADSVDAHERTPISYSAEKGHEAIFKLLLDREDVQANARDARERTPLSYAAERGHVAIVKLLLDSEDVQADSSDMWKRTPLSYAAARGHVETARLLLDSKDVQADSRDRWGATPLLHAAGEGHQAIVKLLLDRKVQADSRDVHERTPLSFAVERGHGAIVKLLLDR